MPILNVRGHFVALSNAAALSTGLVGRRAFAQATVISRNCRIIVGFPAGSSPDLVARLLAEHMKGYAPSLIVDNRPGAGGRLPLEGLKGAERDGSAMTQSCDMTRCATSRLCRPCAPCSFVDVGSLVPADVKTVADFVAWCSANPNLASYGSPGEGTRPHFMATSPGRSAGMPMTHVSYKGFTNLGAAMA